MLAASRTASSLPVPSSIDANRARTLDLAFAYAFSTSYEIRREQDVTGSIVSLDRGASFGRTRDRHDAAKPARTFEMTSLRQE
jgi:hypothetical protein